MPYDHADDERDDNDRTRKSWIANLFHSMTRSPEDDEFYEDDQPQQRPSSGSAYGAGSSGDSNAIARVALPSRQAGGSLTPVRRPTVAQLRIEREHTTVTVRRTVQSYEDVRRAVDGLRENVQQIINIEQTPPDVAKGLIDFLMGGTYALDGSVEKIGEQVYLFTPSSVIIDVEDKSKSPAGKPFFDRE